MATETACKGLRGEIPIRQNAQALVQSAERFVYFLVTPEIAKDKDQITQLIQLLITKKTDNPAIRLKLVISVIPEDSTLLDRAIQLGIEVYRWKFGVMVPFGKILTENSMMVTILSNINPSPRYNLGYQKCNLTEIELMGLQHEILWLIDHLCEKLS